MSAPNRSWILPLVKGLALACVILAVTGFSYEQIGRWHNQQHKFRIGRPVDIGGRTLNIDCAGDGQPAVILESGGGGYGGYGWRKVQPEVAKFTKVCWYDQAGEGWSDPPPIPRSSEMIVHDGKRRYRPFKVLELELSDFPGGFNRWTQNHLDV
ncbi:MAG: hypothetical protein WCE52_00315 [Candidatus Acidiferrum sp.]